MNPKIVEYQVGSSDMIQSTDANVIVTTEISSPGALTTRKRLVSAGWPATSPRSCPADHAFSSHDASAHSAKNSTARVMKNGTFKYGAFIWMMCWTCGSRAASGCAHV